MAVASSSEYSKGLLVGSDKDWFHGELTTVQAEHALTVPQRDCFLVRVDQGALVLSLSHHGQLHHIKIKYGPGWYELESGSAQYSFTELEELVFHYSETAISGLKITLGEVCHQTGHETAFPHYDVITDEIYSKGEPADLLNYKWYHGKLSTMRAHENVSRRSKCNAFFVHHDYDQLILTTRIFDRISHAPIQHSPLGYKLRWDSKVFGTVPEMIEHYGPSLGTPLSQDSQQGTRTPPTSIPFKLSIPIPQKSTSLPSTAEWLGSSPHLMSLQFSLTEESSHQSDTYRQNDPTIFDKEEDLFKISWTTIAPLPIQVAFPSIVKLGDNIYVGGGLTDTYSNYVFRYSNDAWEPLPQSPQARCFSLIVWKNKLTTIGGVLASRQATNAVYTYKFSKWKKVLPPMPTPRFNLSAVAHENRYIIAAGGVTQEMSNGSKQTTEAVEIYIGDNHAWYKTKPLPFPVSQFTTCIINEICYILGGTTNNDEHATAILHTAVASLVENAVLVDSKHSSSPIPAWEQLQAQHSLIYSTPVNLGGKLVAFGGSAGSKVRQGTRFVSTYDFATDTWVECKGAALQAPLYRPGVLKLDDSRVMIVGGQPRMKYMSSTAYMGIYIEKT